MLKKIRIFCEMIKFEHSIFALPFAYLGLFLVSGGLPSLRVFGWVTLAMVALRTTGMCLNRLIDHKIDSENPRTAGRALPRGLLTRSLTKLIAGISLVLFFLSASRLNFLCFALSPIPVALVWIYPYLKRWTWLSHWCLGLILGIAPYGAWLAVRPEANWIPGLLTVTVIMWVSGFDIFYALQDEAFDRTAGLRSVPVHFGTSKAVFIAKSLQGLAVAALAAAGLIAGLGIYYWIGLLCASGLIIREHRLVDRFGLAKINQAFFTMNACVSVILFAGVFLDLVV